MQRLNAETSPDVRLTLADWNDRRKYDQHARIEVSRTAAAKPLLNVPPSSCSPTAVNGSTASWHAAVEEEPTALLQLGSNAEVHDKIGCRAVPKGIRVRSEPERARVAP
jgi:hypothetical protein